MKTEYVTRQPTHKATVMLRDGNIVIGDVTSKTSTGLYVRTGEGDNVATEWFPFKSISGARVLNWEEKEARPGRQ